VVLGRLVGIFGTFYLFRLCYKKKTINFWELSFIAWGGMIRGVIAFALVMKIPYVGSENCKEPEYCFTPENYQLAVTTTLALVYITTLVFGSFMKIYQGWALGSKFEHAEIDDGASHYEEIHNPNEEKEVLDPTALASSDPNAPKGFNQSPLYLWFSKYDEEVLRPYFIRKYNRYLMQAQEQFM
jgi:hypothetical protein